jgi:hypothetical protein
MKIYSVETFHSEQSTYTRDMRTKAVTHHELAMVLYIHRSDQMSSSTFSVAETWSFVNFGPVNR